MRHKVSYRAASLPTMPYTHGAGVSMSEFEQRVAEVTATRIHDIRTPMNAIIGMADVLWDSPLTPAQREYVRLIKDAGDTLLELIDELTVGAAREVTEQDATSGQPARDPQRPLRILVAEDTLDNRALFQLYFKDSPH